MKPFMEPANNMLLSDKEFRDVFCTAFKERVVAQRAAAEAEAEIEKDRPERLKEFWQRLGYTPDRGADLREAARRRQLAMRPAEAWIEEHPEELTAETASTMGELQQLTRRERLRFKASRERLKGIGIQ